MLKLTIIALLAGACLATTPVQQPIPQPQEGRQFRDEIRSSDGIVYGKYGFQDPSGGLRIVKYTAGKDGLTSQLDGVPVGPQPIVWNPNEGIYVEPAPLTYSTVRNEQPFLSERDQQRYLNIDESLVGEDVNDEVRPVNEPKVEVEPKDESDVKVVDSNPKSLHNIEQPIQPVLLNSGIPAVKGLHGVSDDSQDVFPQVISGQRRLVEPQLVPQQYAVKGRSLVRPVLGLGQQVVPKQQVIYQTVQSGLPISIEEHRVSPLGVKRPVVQYQIRPVQQHIQQQHFVQQQQVRQQVQVPREWVRKPVHQQVQQQVKQSGIKGYYQTPLNYQYFIQPFIPSNFDQYVVNKQQVPVQQQVPQMVSVQQQVPQVLSISEQQPLVVDQRHDVVDQKVVDQRHDVVDQKVVDHSTHVSQPVSHVMPNMDEHHKIDIMGQKHVKSPVVPQVVDQKIVSQIPIVISNGGNYRVVGYQIPQQQYYTQQPVQQSVQQPNQQSISVPDIQQYYQVSGSPIPSYGQYLSYNPSLISQPVQYSQDIPVQNSQVGQVVQNVPPVHALNGDQELHVQGGLQGVQHVRVQDDLSVNNRGVQDIRINPLSLDQRQQHKPSLLIHNSGVKSVIQV